KRGLINLKLFVVEGRVHMKKRRIVNRNTLTNTNTNVGDIRLTGYLATSFFRLIPIPTLTPARFLCATDSAVPHTNAETYRQKKSSLGRRTPDKVRTAALLTKPVFRRPA